MAPSARGGAAGTVEAGTAEWPRHGAGPATALAERGAEHRLPVLAPLAPLFPHGGLQRGSTVTVSGSTSLLLALVAGASRAGSWCAVVSRPDLGVVAAAELGVVLERLALVPDPGPDPATVVAALLDALDLVVVGRPEALGPPTLRRLAARARQRGAVLIGVGDWPGADLRLSVTDGVWSGLGQGAGRLGCRSVAVQAEGRGSAARPRRARLWLPAPDGGVATGSAPVRGAGGRAPTTAWPPPPPVPAAAV